MTHNLTDTRAEYHAGPPANDSSNLVTYKCPECGETWEMEEADGPRFCGVCAGDKGDDVRLMIKRKKSPVGPPAPKSEVAIKVAIVSVRHISFDATQDAAGEIERAKFGEFLRREDGSYWLFVDARFDFDEVVEYIQSYGQPSEPETPPDQITINRTFADGSRLELRVSGGEALAFYYEWLWAALEREGD